MAWSAPCAWPASSGSPVNSALYSGWVRHRRHEPRAHAFRYRIGLLYLDLDEQEQVLGLSPLAGTGRFAPFAFRERDFLPQFTRSGMRLAEAVRQRVGEALGGAPKAQSACWPRRAAGAGLQPGDLFLLP